ncbi:hypothetical protein [Streptomyces sp. NBC_00454]|uniref:hypothetical protein n=1 Tax=Streptomyces sp. NBC_00454 TaxID=2975747 RepID=UPI0030E23437
MDALGDTAHSTGDTRRDRGTGVALAAPQARPARNLRRLIDLGPPAPAVPGASA